MEATLTRIVREDILDHDDPIAADTDLFEIGLDSMSIMQLLLVIEDEFGVVIDPADLSRENFRTCSSIATLIRSKK